jgi:polyisoprenoid-binding protein YceI
MPLELLQPELLSLPNTPADDPGSLRKSIIHTSRTALLLSFLCLTPLLQAQEKISLDPAHSEVHFTLGDVLHVVHGTFKLQEGEVDLDPANGKASGAIIVDALSGQSGNSTRDRRMTNDELKAPTFKTVTFAPTQVTGTFNPSSDSTLTIHGIFTLLGTPHEIDVPMKVHVAGDQLQATGSFSVPYVQWGLKDPSTLMLRVNKEVQIDLSLTGTLRR